MQRTWVPESTSSHPTPTRTPASVLLYSAFFSCYSVLQCEAVLPTTKIRFVKWRIYSELLQVFVDVVAQDCFCKGEAVAAGKSFRVRLGAVW